MGVREPAARNPVLRDLRRAAHGTCRSSPPPCAAWRAGRSGGRCRSSGRRPGDVEPLGVSHEQPERRVLLLAERQPALLCPRPCGMARSLSVAGLAANGDFRERRLEAICRCVVILAHAGRVALRAHEVPVLVQLRPVQHVGVVDALVRIEMKPALSARLRGRVSQARGSACTRPSGNSTRYCCSGSSPNVYFTSKVASLPSGPSVSTMNLPSRRTCARTRRNNRNALR